MNWIKVADRPPEEKKRVFAYAPCGDTVFVGYYIDPGHYSDWNPWRIITAMGSTKIMKKKVTHWAEIEDLPCDNSGSENTKNKG